MSKHCGKQQNGWKCGQFATERDYKLQCRVCKQKDEIEVVKNKKEKELRDKFAMAALTGICAHPQGLAGKWEVLSEEAYKAADAMLEARKGEAK